MGDFNASDKFQTMFEGFFLSHALEFTKEEEHKLKYYDLYQRFHDMFNEQLEEFCATLKLTQKEFFLRCREAATTDPKASHYINILLSSVEYETFVALMRIMRPVAEKIASVKADEKHDDSTDDLAGSKASKSVAGVDSSDIDGGSKADAKSGIDVNDIVDASEAKTQSSSADEKNGSK